MITQAVLLLTLGGLLLTGTAITGLLHDKRTQHTTPICGAWAPDTAICCIRPAGHTGWHAHDKLEWMADAWNVTNDGETLCAPAILNGIPLYKPLPKTADDADVQRVKEAKKKGL